MFKSTINNKIIRFFDVTLRDGLQSIPKIYNLSDKKKILEDIIIKRPYSIEIGSIVSSKIVPQMSNSLELYKSANEYNGIINNHINLYMLTPNFKSLEIANLHNIENFSFITSVSDSFQQKNINKTLMETKDEIKKMMETANTTPEKKVKLYISCINKCPIIGQINQIQIVDEILYYYYTYETLDEICLSDTCGTLQFSDFKYIIEELQKRGTDLDKFSLHLHDQSNKQNIKDIILYSMKKGIYRFDVSIMPSIGGCSVTMDNTSGNLSYQQIYEYM